MLVVSFFSPGTIRIRRMDIKDLAHIIRIADTTLDEVYSINLYLDIYQNWPEGFFVAEIEDKITGFLAGAKLSPFEARILMLAVDSRYQRIGIGSRLLYEFEQFCIAQHIRTVRLEVRFSNYRAIQFYQKRKYKITGIIPQYYTNNENAYIMMKNLWF